MTKEELDAALIKYQGGKSVLSSNHEGRLELMCILLFEIKNLLQKQQSKVKE